MTPSNGLARVWQWWWTVGVRRDVVGLRAHMLVIAPGIDRQLPRVRSRYCATKSVVRRDWRCRPDGVTLGVLLSAAADSDLEELHSLQAPARALYDQPCATTFYASSNVAVRQLQ